VGTRPRTGCSLPGAATGPAEEWKIPEERSPSLRGGNGPRSVFATGSRGRRGQSFADGTEFAAQDEGIFVNRYRRITHGEASVRGIGARAGAAGVEFAVGRRRGPGRGQGTRRQGRGPGQVVRPRPEGF